MTATTERTYPGNPVRIHATPDERKIILAKMAELLAWLGEHDEAPLPRWGLEWLISCRDSAEVRRLAGELGIEAQARTAATRAAKRFGPAAYILYAPKGATS